MLNVEAKLPPGHKRKLLAENVHRCVLLGALAQGCERVDPLVNLRAASLPCLWGLRSRRPLVLLQLRCEAFKPRLLSSHRAQAALHVMKQRVALASGLRDEGVERLECHRALPVDCS